MSVSSLSISTQNYLKAIWSLGEWTRDPVTASALAARVGVRMSTVSDAVRKLSEQGLLEHTPYGAITLSERGTAHAIAMVRRHRLLETFLVEVLTYRWEEVHDEAEHLEHAVSDLLIERIDGYLGHPGRDPHGDPIPDAGGRVDRPDAVVLSAMPVGSRGRVERISDADPQLLTYFAEHGIGVGTELDIRPGAPYSDAIEAVVRGTGAGITLGRSATDAVWLSVQEPAPAS
ncbi:MAG: metal-dependent transcriptional regulator [Brachybacterium sp.]|uniref:metal-dependent transcriptional regulator n=1 Tax=Brachybacterium sp. TaxID=1891286 RepID=UPI0026476673|nr:metal-dependent transcriptional regulator [Brachybacterium sp.]MDN5687473.1 metal-dependent transcriptional regulator [Brachybacterium sp.]